MPDPESTSFENQFNFHFVLIAFLTLAVPITVMPYVVDNAFNSPKTLLIILGVSCMVGIYGFQIFNGHKFVRTRTSTLPIIIFLVLLNFFSFFYTANYFFTTIAATLNISCLLFFYFVATHVDGKRAYWLFAVASFSGLLVSILTWFQSFDHYILFSWLPPGSMIMGTIGNSNFLGAYLVFPLFTMMAFTFLLKGKLRLIPVVLLIFMLTAFLFARARSSWVAFFPVLVLFFYLMKRINRFSFSTLMRARPKQTAIYGIIIVLLLIVLWFIIPPRFHVMTSFGKMIEAKTLRLRVQKYFRPSVWLFKENPVFGLGLWSYRNMVYEAQAEISRADPGFFENYPKPKPRRARMPSR